MKIGFRPGLAAVAALALLVLPAQAQQKKKHASRPTPTAPAPAAPAAAPGDDDPVYDPTIDGWAELRSKVRAAEQSNRRVLLNLGTNDCSLCRVAVHAVFEKKFFDPIVKKIIPASIDVTPGSRNAELLARFGIDAKKGLPAFVVLEPDGKEVAVTRNGELAAAAKKGPEAVQAMVLGYLSPD